MRVNRKVTLFGLRRSGNHAIVNWLIPQLQSAVYHINDPPASNIENAFGKYYRCGIVVKGPKSLADIEGQIDLIISHENKRLDTVRQDGPDCSSQYVILLLRDPYNLAASLWHNHKVVKNPNFIVPLYNLESLWIQYAREYLRQTSYLACFAPGHRLNISYNAWFADVRYRRMLSSSMGLAFTDKGINRIAGYGGGSSFDLLKYQNRAQQMAVLDRWRKCVDDEKFWALLPHHGKVARLSEKIFGFFIDKGTKQKIIP